MGILPEESTIKVNCQSCNKQYPFVDGIPLFVPDAPAYAYACVKASNEEIEELATMEAPWAEVLSQRIKKRLTNLTPLANSENPPLDLPRGGEYQCESIINLMVRYSYAPYTSLREGMTEAAYSSAVRLGVANLPRNAKVLDVGTGLGRIVAEYAPFVPEGIVIGLDIAHASVVTARQIVCGNDTYPFFIRQSIPDKPYFDKATLSGFGIANARFMVANSDNVPFAPSQFDLVVAHAAVQITPDPCATLDHLITLVRPGGRLIVADPFLWRLETPPKRRYFPHRAAMVSHIKDRGLIIRQ
jgi:SAM-dependent methyltransferase